MEDQAVDWDSLVASLEDLVFEISRDFVYQRYWCHDPSWLFVPPESFLGQTLRQVHGEGFARPVEAMINQALATSSPRVLDFPTPGQALDQADWWRMRIVPLPRRQPNRVLAVVANISAEHRAQIALQEREELFRLLSQNSRDLICLHAVDGRYIYLSPAVTAILGYEAADLVGESPFEYFHPDDLQRSIQPSYERALRAEADNRVEYRMRHRQGHWVWLETLTTAITDSAGQVVRLQTSTRDISDRKRLEEETRKLSLVARNTSNAVIITDAEGRIEWVNEAFTTISGFSLAEVSGRKPGDLLQGVGSDPKTVRYLRERIQKRQPFFCEMVNYRRDGVAYWVLIEGEPVFDHDGRLVNFIAVESDITFRKNSEALLRQAKDDAEAANQAKSQFLATMSHEIRTPMHGILGMADLALQSATLEDTREYLSHLRGSAEHLMELLGDILDLSKIEAGKMVLEERPIHLRSVVDRLVHLWQARFQQRELDFRTNWDQELPATVALDSVKFNQILNNLLNNALKFTREGGVELSLRAGERGLEGYPSFEVVVSDTGVGIPFPRQGALFQPFTQADNSTTRRFGGTGLGLAISRNLAHLMGGDLSFTSQEGRGTTFRLTLPLKPTQAVQRHRPVLDLPGTYNGRVLVAEDNRVNFLIISKILEQLGLAVELAADGAQAVEKALAGEYGLIFMDIHMPTIDGLDATRQIRRRLHAHVPIIALTADALAGDRDRCLLAGMDDYIAKPYAKTDIEACVGKYLHPTV